MSEPTPPALPDLPQQDLNAKVNQAGEILAKTHGEGASWFFWIAGLSVINSAVVLLGSQWSFLIGLGITQVIDGIALAVVQQVGEHIATTAKLVAFGLDVVVAGTFALWGILAMKRHRWAYVLGMILYALDGLIFLLVGDYLSLGFHVFALFFLFKGFKACGQLNKLHALTVSVAAP